MELNSLAFALKAGVGGHLGGHLGGRKSTLKKRDVLKGWTFGWTKRRILGEIDIGNCPKNGKKRRKLVLSEGKTQISAAKVRQKTA